MVGSENGKAYSRASDKRLGDDPNSRRAAKNCGQVAGFCTVCIIHDQPPFFVSPSPLLNSQRLSSKNVIKAPSLCQGNDQFTAGNTVSISCLSACCFHNLPYRHGRRHKSFLLSRLRALGRFASRRCWIGITRGLRSKSSARLIKQLH